MRCHHLWQCSRLTLHIVYVSVFFICKGTRYPYWGWCGNWQLWFSLFEFDMIWYIFLTAIGLTPSGSSTVHIYTQTIHRTTQLTNWEECGPCPVFASYTLAFALQLRKKHRKTSVRIFKECQLAQWKQKMQNRLYIAIRIHKHNNKNT